MRYLVFILLSALTVFGENPYDQIAKRNAFDLTEKKPSAILPPVHLVLTDVYLTGIARKAKIYTAYMAIKGTAQNKFLGLKEGQQKDGIKVIKITKDTVFISRNGILQELTFKQNSLPSFIAKVAPKQKTKDKREERGEGGGRSSSRPQTAGKGPSRPSGPQVVTVPSRRPKIDPRIIEKGLEYLSKTEDNEKREYLLKRLESLQSGQSKIKSDIDSNERRRQYDEWRKSREKGR